MLYSINMKKYFYIFSFTVLGLLLQFMVHAGLEIFYLNHHTPFKGWYAFHSIAGIELFILGLSLGFWAGVHFWRVIYVEKSYRKWIK